MTVHRKLGAGLSENSYQRALEAEFAQQNISFQSQRLLEVRDQENNDMLLGYYIPDFIVDDQVIVEIKALGGINNSHIAQVIGYLAVTGLKLGLLLNFGTRSLQQRRIFPPTNITQHTVNRQWLFIPDWMKSE
jgi:GxxExxY protein